MPSLRIYFGSTSGTRGIEGGVRIQCSYSYAYVGKYILMGKFVRQLFSFEKSKQAAGVVPYVFCPIPDLTKLKNKMD